MNVKLLATPKQGRLPVLYITNNLPFPPTSGGQLRELQLLKRLQTEFAVHLVAFVQDEAKAKPNIPDALTFLSSATLIQTVPEIAGPSLPSRVRAHYAPSGWEIVRGKVALLNPAFVHVEGYFLVHYVPAKLRLPIVLVEENIEFHLEESAERFGFYPVGSSLLTRAWEVEAWRKVSHCVAVTLEDTNMIRILAGRPDVACITNGMDHLHLVSSIRPIGLRARHTFLYVANYEWQPSLDAARYLLQDIWPLIRAISPNLYLMLAGTGMNADLEREAAKQEGVTVWGPFVTFSDVARHAAAFLYPLRFGGGLKVKLIEAIGAGLPVVTTSPALRGFSALLRPFISIAETPRAFAEAAVAAIQREDRLERANAARAVLVSSLPTWDAAAAQLAAVWSSACNAQPTASAYDEMT